eukprot:Nk52_evm14s96 gene=Nk52_evmTU14s96
MMASSGTPIVDEFEQMEHITNWNQERKRMAELPISKHLDKALNLCLDHDIICVSADTGSGKSTLLPHYFATSPKSRFKCCVASPSVVSTVSLKNFTQKLFPELRYGFAAGGEVRYDGSEDIVYCTAGHLVRRLMRNELLQFDVIFLDEAHTVSQDYEALEYMLKYRWPMRSFKMVICSATLNPRVMTERWRGYAPVKHLKVVVPHYKITETFESTAQNPEMSVGRQYMDKIVKLVTEANRKMPGGHFLVFLPGRSEIDYVYTELFKVMSLDNTDVFALCSGMPDEEVKLAVNQKVMAPTDKSFRAIILSTDVVENSTTIPGVVYVINSGRQKQIESIETGGMSTRLKTTACSKFSCAQRKGRTGRTNPGVCHHLMSKAEYNSLPDTYPDEMSRAPIVGLVIEAIYYDLDPKNIFTGHGKEVSRSVMYMKAEGLLVKSGTEEESDPHRRKVGLHSDFCPRKGNAQGESQSSIESAEGYSLSLDAKFVSHIPVDIPLGLLLRRLFISSWSDDITRQEGLDSIFFRTLAVALVACLDVTSGNGFLFTPRKTRETKDADKFEKQLQNVLDVYQKKFPGSNELVVLLMVFITMYDENDWKVSNTAQSNKEKSSRRRDNVPFAQKVCRWSNQYSLNNKLLKFSTGMYHRLFYSLQSEEMRLMHSSKKTKNGTVDPMCNEDWGVEDLRTLFLGRSPSEILDTVERYVKAMEPSVVKAFSNSIFFKETGPKKAPKWTPLRMPSNICVCLRDPSYMQDIPAPPFYRLNKGSVRTDLSCSNAIVALNKSYSQQQTGRNGTVGFLSNILPIELKNYLFLFNTRFGIEDDSLDTDDCESDYSDESESLYIHGGQMACEELTDRELLKCFLNL